MSCTDSSPLSYLVSAFSSYPGPWAPPCSLFFFMLRLYHEWHHFSRDYRTTQLGSLALSMLIPHCYLTKAISCVPTTYRIVTHSSGWNPWTADSLDPEAEKLLCDKEQLSLEGSLQRNSSPIHHICFITLGDARYIPFQLSILRRGETFIPNNLTIYSSNYFTGQAWLLEKRMA